MTKLLMIGILFLMVIIPFPSSAEHVKCGRRADIVANLGTSYGEVLAGQGVTVNGFVMELFISPKLGDSDPKPQSYSPGSWTAIITGPDGTSCIAATGENWEVMLGDPA